jgi:predicted RNA-binding Zn ribbon-like protein
VGVSATSPPLTSDQVRDPAPGRLELVHAFVNTADVMDGLERIGDAKSLRAWLRTHGLIDSRAKLATGDVERAIEVREALRDLLEGRSHGIPIDNALRSLNVRSGDAILRVSFDGDGEPWMGPAAGGLDGAFAQLFAIIHAAALEGTWTRLKVCAADDCRWAFYDSSKNRCGTWCNMASCGNRAKARSYRERRRKSTVK